MSVPSIFILKSFERLDLKTMSNDELILHGFSVATSDPMATTPYKLWGHHDFQIKRKYVYGKKGCYCCVYGIATQTHSMNTKPLAFNDKTFGYETHVVVVVGARFDEVDNDNDVGNNWKKKLFARDIDYKEYILLIDRIESKIY